MTPILGMTQDGLKKTLRDARALPKTVIYDPELTLTLPAKLSATSGMNAIAHSVEALYAQDANPIISLMAEESIRVLANALPEIVRDTQDVTARGDALYGAWLAGQASARWVWRCITSSATRSAAASICPMRKHTPSSAPRGCLQCFGRRASNGAARQGIGPIRQAGCGS